MSVFDRVFPETTEQEGIWEYVSDSVDSFVEGYNVSIMAYGQSGVTDIFPDPFLFGSFRKHAIKHKEFAPSGHINGQTGWRSDLDRGFLKSLRNQFITRIGWFQRWSYTDGCVRSVTYLIAG
jgi:hypothetical protein